MRIHKIEPGRYVLYGKDYGWQFRLEVSNRYNFGLGWNFKKEEQDISLSLYCWRLFSVWFTLESKRFKYRSEPIETGIVWQSKEHVIKIELLSQKEFDSSKPAIIYKYWDYRDWLFGRPKYSETPHGKEWHLKHVKIELPEGSYDLAMDFYTSYWHRPRSPFTKAVERVEVVPDRPVGVPGKGENSWDLDEDATFSSTMPVNGRTPEEIAEDFKQDILKTREGRASKGWVPEKQWQHA